MSTKISVHMTNSVYRVLHHFNTNIDEYNVIFTSGATAALKLVAESFDFGQGKIALEATSC